MLQFKTICTDEDYGLALDIITKSFATVADDFHLTPENCPSNPAFMGIDKLKSLKNKKSELFILFSGDSPAGFVAIEQSSNSATTFYIEKVAILPGFRHRDLGRKLMIFAEEQIADRGGKRISLGIIYENVRLRNWYESMGYEHTDTREFDHLPFTVGFLSKQL
jgi:ribosomal protein S18 acetylase RimI-like enzyme